MPTLLVVHHTVSPAMHELLECALEALKNPDLAAVDVQLSPALSTSIHDVLQADAYLLGTPANFGYMSGALKHFFDTIYYPCLTGTIGRPYGLWVHGNSDTGGAVRAVESIATGLQWKNVSHAVQCDGTNPTSERERVAEIALLTAAHLLE